MDPTLIKSLIDALTGSDLAELEFSKDGSVLRLVKGSVRKAERAPSQTIAATAPVEATGSDDAVTATTREFCSPLYGMVHLQRSPGDAPFVKVGETVRAGQTLCTVEAMKVFTELRAEFDCTVEAVIVSSGQEVEAGQVLFRLT